MALNQKQMTAHLRKRLKVAKIKARVNMIAGTTRVYPIAADLEFNEAEQRQIRQIAKDNHFTFVRAVEIDVERMTDPHGVHLEYHPRGAQEQEIALHVRATVPHV